MSTLKSVALVGAGAMGGALLDSWLAANAIDAGRSVVFEPAAGAALKARLGKVGVALNPAPESVRVEVLVLAVKPQAAASVLPAFSALARDALVISVMAGASVDSISRHLGGAPRVARAMPNLPAQIGKGVSGLYAPPAVDEAARAVVDSLMAAVGETVWVENEAAIDVVTALSGSGPAYCFLLVEALAEAGADLGLSPEAAVKLARATVSGAGAMLDIDPRPPGEMRAAVTSPGGTTAAALDVLDGPGGALRKLVKAAVTSATKRAAELTD